jgi:twitching motility protein PilT
VDAIREGLDEVLRLAAERGASDVHLKVPAPPLARVHGELVRLGDMPRLAPADVEALLAAMLDGPARPAKRRELAARGEVAFSYAHAGLGRFRVSAYRQRGSLTIVLRPVPFEAPRLERLGLPAGLGDLADAPDGLVLVCGPPGSGVTTTLAALVDRMNDGPPRSVVTIEDPVEVLHADRECAIGQREVGVDTGSFAEGLAGVLRHDPDIVVVGALPDLATAELALAAAAGGALVLAAATAAGPGDAVRDIVALAPPPRRARVRGALASVARAVIHQQLVPRADGPGRRAVVEVVWGGRAVHRLAAAEDPYAGPAEPLDEVASVRPAAIAVGSPAATSR